MKAKNEGYKVFEFAKDGNSYTIKAKTKAHARKFLLDEYDIDIKNCFEVNESEWDKPISSTHENNNTKKPKFYFSLRELFNNDATELLLTTDASIIY